MEALRKHIGIMTGACIFSVLVKLLSLIKVSYIFGSHAAFFSAGSIVSPLSGVYGAGFGFCALLMGACMKIVWGANPIFYLLYHIPSFCGALFWAGSRFLCSLVLPLLCMVAFIAHPEGGAAWLYTLYWTIPMIVYLSRYTHIFTDALSCTFIMHAVGSVLWLYGTHMPAVVWISLIPIVAIERLCLAFAMTGAYVVMHGVTNYVKTKALVKLCRQRM